MFEVIFNDFPVRGDTVVTKWQRRHDANSRRWHLKGLTPFESLFTQIWVVPNKPNLGYVVYRNYVHYKLIDYFFITK